MRKVPVTKCKWWLCCSCSPNYTARLLDLQPENENHSRLGDDTAYNPNQKLPHQICRRSCNELSYSDFYWNHMKKNWPLVLTNVSSNWECHLHWTLKSTGNNNDNNDNAPTQPSSAQIQHQTTAINFDYLRRKVGNCHVPVANCSKEYYNSHEKREMCFFDYLDYWQRKSQQDCSNNKETENVIENFNFVKPTESNIENLYLKDWHLKAQIPDYDFYTVPKYFASDWLNEYLLDNEKDDYRFVYMGPKNSWTPFHADVFGSYSWSTNIVGCKRWILLPPGEENALKDNLGNLPFRIEEQQLVERNLRYFIIQQTENEAIFVPSCWYHQVHNVSDTISVNHNWFNACNLQQIWQNLAFSMQQVVAEIEDCRQMDNFEEHCHTMLRASFGINIYDFLNILEYIAEKRLKCFAIRNNNNHPMIDDGLGGSIDEMNKRKKYLLFDTFTLNDFHICHDLQRINAVVQEMLRHAVICDKRALLHRKCLCLEELTRDYNTNILK